MTSPDDLPPVAESYEVEDYESLGHTFLGGQGSHGNAAAARGVEVVEYHRVRPMDWTRLIWWGIGVAVIALCLLVAGVIIAIVHHVHATHAATITTGPSKNSGQVFAVIVVIVVTMLAVRAVVRFIRGE